MTLQKKFQKFKHFFMYFRTHHRRNQKCRSKERRRRHRRRISSRSPEATRTGICSPPPQRPGNTGREGSPRNQLNQRHNRPHRKRLGNSAESDCNDLLIFTDPDPHSNPIPVVGSQDWSLNPTLCSIKDSTWYSVTI